MILKMPFSNISKKLDETSMARLIIGFSSGWVLSRLLMVPKLSTTLGEPLRPGICCSRKALPDRGLILSHSSPDRTFPSILAVFSASPAPAILMNLSALFLWLILRQQGREKQELEALEPPTESAGGTRGMFALTGRQREMKSIEHGFLVVSLGCWLNATLGRRALSSN